MSVHTCLHELTIMNKIMSLKVTGTSAIVFGNSNLFIYAMFLFEFVYTHEIRWNALGISRCVLKHQLFCIV